MVGTFFGRYVTKLGNHCSPKKSQPSRCKTTRKSTERDAHEARTHTHSPVAISDLFGNDIREFRKKQKLAGKTQDNYRLIGF